MDFAHLRTRPSFLGFLHVKKVWWGSMQYFLSYRADTQTHRHTDTHTDRWKTENIISTKKFLVEIIKCIDNKMSIVAQHQLGQKCYSSQRKWLLYLPYEYAINHNMSIRTEMTPKPCKVMQSHYACPPIQYRL